MYKINANQNGTDDLMGIGKKHRVPDPENFEANLLENYRDYYDSEGELIPDREKNYEAFAYFVTRILHSVNTRQSSNATERANAYNISKRYTVSDEAFALVMVQNYFNKWRVQSTMDKTKWTQVPARWTSSDQGNKALGWEDEGIDAFFENCKMVEEKRGEDRTGSLVDRLWEERMAAEKGLERQPKSKQKKVKRKETKTKRVKSQWRSANTLKAIAALQKVKKKVV